MTEAPEPIPQWRREMITLLRDYATDLRTAAARQEALADKIEFPPEGVRVEYGGHNVVRFVGPPVCGSSGRQSPLTAKGRTA